MEIKLIAIGNITMSDEGIAIKVAETIKEELELCSIKVIFGETDADYCIDSINDNDFILLLDATYLGIAPGTVTTIPIEKSNFFINTSFAQHDLSILKLISLYNKKVTGYIIGIEVDSINFDNKLSETLQEKLSGICSEIKDIALKIKFNTNVALNA